MSVELVIFDMAGTTVRDNKEVETCFARALVQSGLNISEERILALQGWAKTSVFHLLWTEHLGEDHPEIQEKADASYALFKKILEDHYAKKPVVPQPFAEQTFKWLRGHNIKIALTTGFYREVTNILLKQLGWDKGLNKDYTGNEESIIDLSLCSDDVENGRPAPELIQLAMRKLDVQNAEYVVNLGDTPSDLQSGKAANVGLSLGVLNGTHTHAQLRGYDNDGFIKDLSELKKVLESRLLVEI
jgi:phosphonatase-like hydrolase